MSADVVEGEGKCGQQRGGDSEGIHAKTARADEADRERAAATASTDGGDSSQRWTLRATRHGVEQTPRPARCIAG